MSRAEKVTKAGIVRVWVRISFATIFADIPRGWLKLMTSRLLFSK